jgi:hypothetical protein
LEVLALPSGPEEVGPFIAALKDSIARFPEPPEMHMRLENFGKIEGVL